MVMAFLLVVIVNGSPEPTDDMYFKSNKLILAKGKKYLTKYHYFADHEYKGKEQQTG